MRWMTGLLWFVMAFLTGAGLFLVTRPVPVLHALVLELRGPGLFERCRQAGACAQLELAPPQQPHPREVAPADLDRG
ncbi:MAG TPA: hypothetical protein VFI23_08630 [Rhizomicrobium sp.]|nr:hypothetical protein [Rhizomicrobium sp.]